MELVQYLIETCGSHIGIQTWDTMGGTPLWWAKHVLPNNHPVIKYLESIGAPLEVDPMYIEEREEEEGE